MSDSEVGESRPGKWTTHCKNKPKQQPYITNGNFLPEVDINILFDQIWSLICNCNIHLLFRAKLFSGKKFPQLISRWGTCIFTSYSLCASRNTASTGMHNSSAVSCLYCSTDHITGIFIVDRHLNTSGSAELRFHLMNANASLRRRLMGSNKVLP